jgi:hypothetical protein
MFDPTIEFHGPAATHDMPCAVYRKKPAVLDCNTGVFHPSWSAQSDGWQLVRATSWFQRLVLKIAFSEDRGHGYSVSAGASLNG